MKRGVARRGAPTCLLLLAAAVTNASPRWDVPPPEPETPEAAAARQQQRVLDTSTWLPRLAGRYNYEGTVQYFQTLKPGATAQSEPEGKSYAAGTCDESCLADIPNLITAKGKGDCIAVGSGPGVQCVIHVVWNEEWGALGTAVEGGVSFLGPAAILYGLDPNAMVIRYLLLNTNGIAESEAGVVRGDTLSWTYATHCESSSMDRCRAVTRLRVPPGGSRAQTNIDFEQWDGRLARWQRVTSIMLDMRRVPQS